MNLIITDSLDTTSDSVIEWLISHNIKVKRLNNESVQQISYNLSNVYSSFEVENKTPSKVWHRRGKLNTNIKVNNENSLNQYLYKESDSAIKSIELDLKQSIDYVGSFIKETENYKLTQLNIAKLTGLKIPNTLVTNSKKQLSQFSELYEKVITKDIRYGVNFNSENDFFYSSGTFILDNSMVESLNDTFNLILVQEYIEKEYEIRIFFFKNKLYPMGIFSQSNEKTKIDFRNYDTEKPNRCVPLRIPKLIEQKILDFAERMDLNTGSIDMIYSMNKEYIFLEVNPQGQLDWLSKNCNYYIEKEIANFFID